MCWEFSTHVSKKSRDISKRGTRNIMMFRIVFSLAALIVGSNNLGVDERRTDGGSPGKNVQKPNQRRKPAAVRASQKTVTWADRVRGVNLVKQDNNP